jgi:hypothetical protein
MKDPRRSRKGLAAAAFAIFLAGLYWYQAASEPEAPDVPRPASVTLQALPTRESGRGAQGSRELPSDIGSVESLDWFPYSRNGDQAVQSVAAAANPPVSGRSRNAAELADEITGRSSSKDEAVAQMDDLARRYPDSRIRGQAVACLAGIANDVTLNTVMEALLDAEPGVRRVAMEALFGLGERVPIQPLRDLAARSRDTAPEITAFVEQFTEHFAQPSEAAQTGERR